MGKTLLSLRRAGPAMVVAAVLLTGCGDDETSPVDVANGERIGDETPEGEPDADSSDDASGPDETTEADDGAGAETFEITISGGEVNPPFDTYDVAHGAQVRIEVTSDIPEELHLHGYDLELALEPGEPGVLEFTADIQGGFELETHELGQPLVQIEVG